MKKIMMILLAALLLCGAAAMADGMLNCEPDGYVATGGAIPDPKTYAGSWQQAYLQILNGHSVPIRAYEMRPIVYYLDYDGDPVTVPCKPVGLTDITADGIPELIFMEVATEERGDLWIYSSDGANARCILYVPGITRIGYDDAAMTFDVYLSSAGGGTLVLEYDEYEWPWKLQLKRDGSGRYVLLNYLWAEYDNSNWDNDRYYMSGAPVSGDDYSAALKTWQSGRTATLSTYTTDDTSHYGFSMTWAEAVNTLSAYSGPTPGPMSSPKFEGVYGLTYNVKNQYIKVLAKAWDKRNGIWWVECEIPYHGQTRVLWTGYKRFDHSTLSLDDLPEESW